MADTVKTITIKVDGKDALVDINEIKDALKSTNEEVGEMKDTSLDGFKSSIGDLTSKFKAGEIGVKGLAKGVLSAGKAMMTAFVTNPILLAITAIVAVVVALYNVLKTFEPLIDAIEKGFAGLVAVFNVLKTSIFDVITGNKSLKESFNGMGDAMSDAAKAAWDLKAAEQALLDQQVLLEVQAAKTKTRIDALLIQSTDVTKSEKERIVALEEVLKLQQEQHEKNVKWAKEAERIALDKIIIGKKFTEQEIRDVRRLGIVKLRELQQTKTITDEEIQIYADALVEKENLLQEEIAITENAKVQRNAIQQEAAAKEQAEQDAISAARAAWRKRENDKERVALDTRIKDRQEYTDNALELAKKEFDSLATGYDDKSDAQKKYFTERKKLLIDQINKDLAEEKKYIETVTKLEDERLKKDYESLAVTKETSDQRNAILTERNNLESASILQISKLEEDAQRKRTAIAKENLKLREDFILTEADTKFEILKATIDDEQQGSERIGEIYSELHDKNEELRNKGLISEKEFVTQRLNLFDEEEKRLEDFLLVKYDQSVLVQERILDNDRLTQEEVLDVYETLQANLKAARDRGLISELEYQNTKYDYAKASSDRILALELARYDRSVMLQRRILDSETLTNQEVLDVYDTLQVNLQEARDEGLISEQEYQDRKYDLEKESTDKIKQLNADKLANGLDVINTLSAADKAATQTAINLEDRKLKDGKINQEQYDKNVADIQAKAAKREKAYAVVSAIINTAQGISKALASTPPPLSFVLAAVTGALGIAQIAAILSASPASKTAPSVPSASAGGDTSTAPSTSFSFSPEPTTPTNAPVKSYVVGQDVTTQNQMDRQIISNGTI